MYLKPGPAKQRLPSSTLVFYVNGKKVEDDDIDPEWTLIHYLRKKRKLTGTKLGCAEGGCGACTVMVSKYDETSGRPIHMSVNACLTPIAAMHGLAVTTIEGIGSVKTKLHPLQKKIASEHGSQCGFCTPGIVMSMYTLMRSVVGQPSWEEMLEIFQGNLCRCTGYRPILQGYKAFVADENGENKLTTNDHCPLRERCCQNRKISCKHDAEKEKGKVVNGLTNGAAWYQEVQQTPSEKLSNEEPEPTQETIFPPELVLSRKYDREELTFSGPRVSWHRPTSLSHLLRLKSSFPDAKIVNGNTEIGVEVKFKNILYSVQISPNQIKGLNELAVVESPKNNTKLSCVKVGASVSVSTLQKFLRQLVNDMPDTSTRIFREMLKMFKLFAGKQIRNVGTLSGNIMTGSPISDLNPVLMAASATVELMSEAHGSRFVKIDEHFWTGYRKNIVKPDEVMLAVYIPFTHQDQYFRCYKQSRRKEDDIAIVNAAFNVNIQNGMIKEIHIAYGGMAPTTKMAIITSSRLVGVPFNRLALEKAYEYLNDEFPLSLSAPGGMATYRRTLLLSLFLKFYLDVRQDLETSAGENHLLNHQTTLEQNPLKSSQYFTVVPSTQTKDDLVGRPVVHQSAYKQAAGEAVYCDDMPRFENESYLCFVVSTRAHAKILNVDSTKAVNMEGVIAFLSAKDLPKERNNCGAIIHDEEVFASEKVYCQGQIIGCVVAETLAIAQRASKLVSVEYEDIHPLIITIEEAMKHRSFFSATPAVERRGDVEEIFRKAEENGDIIVEGETRIGGQEHFYLETQNSVAVPSKEGNEITIYASSQHPSEVQRQAALVLGLPFNKVVCKVKRIGGGFGGKEVRSCILAIPVAFAAHYLKRPVRMSLDRDEDMMISGQRHPFLGRYKACVTPKGKITACHFHLYSNGGWSLDLSDAVMERAMLHVTNCCNIPNLTCEGYVCKTNLPSNTAFRGFGAPQAMFIGETMLHHVASTLKIDINKIHEINFYNNDDVTYFGQNVPLCNIQKCWEECVNNSKVSQRRSSIDKFNREQKYLKRGLSVIPTMFGIAFSTPFLNQAGALVLVYRDGSVLVSHGGTEMGQGLHTKMIQVVSRAFGIPAELVQISETATDKVPNTSATAGSASSDLNGMAVLNACETIKERLNPVISKNTQGSWREWINTAYFERISLAATGFYKLPDMGRDPKTGLGNTFSYFTYGAACSEVQVDCLTGDHQILRTDIVMDLGESLNPAIDIGQVEGAFIQGTGLFTLEQVLVSPTGALLTRGPGAYKIPSFGDIPAEFNVSILKGSSNPRAIYSSKAIGEPPLFLASSVFFAIRDAIASFRCGNGDKDWFRFDSPATSSQIRLLLEDDIVKRVSDGFTDFVPWGLQP